MAAKDHISDNQFHLHLFHATPTKNVEYIQAQGLGPNSYLTNDYALAQQYAENQWMYEPTSIITVRANPRNLVPDYNSFKYPVHVDRPSLTAKYNVYKDFDETQLKSGVDWKNSLKQTGSVLHVGTIKPHNILNIEPFF